MRAVACLLAGLSLARGSAQSLEPSACAARLVRQAEPLPVDALIEASLVLSGASGEGLAASRARLDELAAAARALAATERDPRPLGNAVLALLHERALRTYDEEQTRVDVLLAGGRYNCVSSAVLYMILARAAGLSVAGVRTHDHAFCAVRAEDGLIDVETTSVHGFDPGRKRQFQDQFGRVTGFTYVPANRDPSRVEIDERGLLSLIPQNLASVATRRRQFAAAVAPAVDGHVLGRDGESRRKLLITVANAATSLAAGGSVEEALALLKQGSALYGPDERLVRLRRDLVHNEVAELMRGGQIEQAMQTADRRRSSGEIDEAGWRDLAVSAEQLRAQAAAREQGPLAGLRLVEEAIGRLGRDPRLLDAERVYRNNFEVEAHNAMAAAFNAGRYAEARAIIERALEQLPASARLRGDLARVAREMERR